MTERILTLAEEVVYLHDALFYPIAIHASVVERYQDAHRLLFPGQSPLAVSRIVSRRLDVEAVEIALRRRRACPEVTRKIQILCYLVEIRSPYQERFIALHREPVRAVASLMSCLISTIWKACKGECLVRLHGLV